MTSPPLYKRLAGKRNRFSLCVRSSRGQARTHHDLVEIGEAAAPRWPVRVHHQHTGAGRVQLEETRSLHSIRFFIDMLG